MTNAEVATSNVVSAGNAAVATVAAGAPSHESLLHRVEHALCGDAAKTLTVMEAIGRDCLRGLSVVQAYLPGAAALATAIFPQDAALVSGTTNTIDLITKAVATVEAKWTAGNESGKTGAQKFADVLSLVEGSATDLLSGLGVKVDAPYIGNLINIIVGILNVRTVAQPVAS